MFDTVTAKLIAAAIFISVIVALVFGVMHYGTVEYDKGAGYQKGIDQAAQDQLKIQAATEYGNLKDAADRKDAANQKIISDQEVQHEKDVATISTQSRRLGSLVLDGQLRDPNAHRCGASDSSATTQSGTGGPAGGRDTSNAGGLLSKELSGLLLKLTSEADRINAAYATCRADAIGQSR